MIKEKFYRPGAEEPRTLLLGVYAFYNTGNDEQNYFEEFLSLVKTGQYSYEETFFTKLRSLDKGKFLTKGKFEDLVKKAHEHGIERIICSEQLTPLQHKSIEDATGAEVIDRQELIITIFRNSAATAEGSIQVDMAEAHMLKARLSMKGKELAQQAGFVGGKGPGETYKEYLSRNIERIINQAKKKLVALSKTRDGQRKQRLSSGIPLVSLIGYTNAGKSSLLNILTKSTVLVEDKLFATLDVTTRELFIEQNRKVLLSDTVGFISQLPPQLIEAFKSTLDEVAYATHLLHVVDISNKGWKDQIIVVNTTLEDLKIKDKPVLYVFCKVDKLTEAELEALAPSLEAFSPHVIIHTQSREGVAPLMKYLKETFSIQNN